MRRYLLDKIAKKRGYEIRYVEDEHNSEKALSLAKDYIHYIFLGKNKNVRRLECSFFHQIGIKELGYVSYRSPKEEIRDSWSLGRDIAEEEKIEFKLSSYVIYEKIVDDMQSRLT